MNENLIGFGQEQLITVQFEKISLKGYLNIPKEPLGIILFAHGSGSGRNSIRNQLVARELHQNSLATLLIDLLTEEEETIDRSTANLRFDIELLAERLTGATYWLLEEESTKNLEMAYFGASTGAAAALIAAVENKNLIKSVVSRGGRPDLAGSYLPKVRAPTLLIVGGNDIQVLDLNKKAFALLSCKKQLEIIPNATHLFEEPGTLEEAACISRNWFLAHF